MNDDTISRQAAIDEIAMWIGYIKNGKWYWYSSTTAVTDSLQRR